MEKCGIYIIKNNINNLCYVGQSVNIKCRWIAHKNSAKNTKDLSHNTKIHQAMYQLGVENFYYEILEECDYSKLDEREKYWIQYYDSYNNGYNMTLGGDSNRGETNGRALLTELEVIDIRNAYNAHIPFRQVFEKYGEKISKRGLQKVWRFETWKHVLPEVYTDENRKWHATFAKSYNNGSLSLGKTNKQRACSEDEIQKIRELRKQGLSYNKIAIQVGRSPSVVRKYCLFQECKNPDRTTGIQIKNTETGLIFSSQIQASKWAKCDHHLISKNKNTQHSAGTVPTTGEPAHWVTL